MSKETYNALVFNKKYEHRQVIDQNGNSEALLKFRENEDFKMVPKVNKFFVGPQVGPYSPVKFNFQDKVKKHDK